MALRRVTARGTVDTTGRRKATRGTGEATGRSRLEAAGSRLSVEKRAALIGLRSLPKRANKRRTAGGENPARAGAPKHRQRFLTGRRGAQRRAQRSAPTLLNGCLLVHSGSNRSRSQSRRLGAVALVAGADERLAARDPAASVARLVTAQCALDCSLLEWRSGRRARARRHA